MDLTASLRTAARANRLANHRLHASMAALAPAEFDAPRTSFFPSLGATLNHILAVDGFYLAALHREPDMEAQWQRFQPAKTLAELVPRARAGGAQFVLLPIFGVVGHDFTHQLLDHVLPA